ncbi:MAG TPA: hypothetical protein PLE85_07555 [Bacteroidales bacterium]|nr:hypothetical protein [Bacteroidales bacterium]
MRNLFYTLAAVILSTYSLYSQNNDEYRYLFNHENIRFSGFGGPLVMFGQAEGDFGVYSGGGGALLINQRYFLGGYGMGLATAHYRFQKSVAGKSYPELRTSFGHGGFWLGYVHRPSALIHLASSLKLGWGQISLYEETYHFDHYDYLAKDNVFVMTPMIEAEVNLTTWFKVNAGLGFQWTAGVGDRVYQQTQERIYQGSDYSSPVLNLGLLFGGFGDRRR